MYDAGDEKYTRQEWMIQMTGSVQDKNRWSRWRKVYKTRMDDPDDKKYTRQEWIIDVYEVSILTLIQ